LGQQTKKGLAIPDAANEVTFALTGSGKIIGVGNGDPTSLEPDKFLDRMINIPLKDFKEFPIQDTASNIPEVNADFNDLNWRKAFSSLADINVKAWVYRGSFNLTKQTSASPLTFFYKSIGSKQSIYINGRLLAANVNEHKSGDIFTISRNYLKEGKNSIAIVAIPLKKVNSWDVVNTDPGLIQYKTPAAPWKRKLFNGLAQVIIQSNGKASGDIVLTATSPGLINKTIVVHSAK